MRLIFWLMQHDKRMLLLFSARILGVGRVVSCVYPYIRVSVLYIPIDTFTSTRHILRWCSGSPSQIYADHHCFRAKMASRCLWTPRSATTMPASPILAEWSARMTDTRMWCWEESTRRGGCFGRECAHAMEWDGVGGVQMLFVAPKRCGHKHPKRQRWGHKRMNR